VIFSRSHSFAGVSGHSPHVSSWIVQQEGARCTPREALVLLESIGAETILSEFAVFAKNESGAHCDDLRKKSQRNNRDLRSKNVAGFYRNEILIEKQMNKLIDSEFIRNNAYLGIVRSRFGCWERLDRGVVTYHFTSITFHHFLLLREAYHVRYSLDPSQTILAQVSSNGMSST